MIKFKINFIALRALIANISFIFTLLLSASCSSPQATSKAQQHATLVTETSLGIKNGIPSLEVKKYKLPNGLTVLLSQNAKLPTFTFFLFYGVGSKYESPGITGSTHFLEHMMFKGAKKFGKGAFDKLIEGNGGLSNAYTTEDMTAYYESLPKAALDITLEMEADRMQNLLLEENDFNSEKNVVLEERKMRYENSPNGQLFIRMFDQMMTGTPYQIPVIGSEADIKRVTRDEVQKYFKTFYAPNNAVLLVVGDIQYADTLSKIERYFSAIPASVELEKIKSAKDHSAHYESSLKADKIEKIYGQSEKPLFMWTVPSTAYGQREAYVLDFLAHILGESNSSFLQQKYVMSAKPLLSSVYASNYNLMNTGVFMVGGEFLVNSDLGTFRDNLKKQLKLFCDTELTDINLLKAKNHALLKFYDDLDTNHGVADYLGTMEIFMKDYRHYEKEMNIYQQISVQDLKDECQKLLVKKSYMLGLWDKYTKKIKL